MSSSLLEPLELRLSPARELAAISLRQVQRENDYLLHGFCWLVTSMFLVVLNLLTTGMPPAWSLWPIAIWGMVVAGHGATVRKSRRQRYAADHQRQRQRAEQLQSEPVSVAHAELRRKLLGSLGGARDALLETAPDVAADLSLGEARALTTLAWLDGAADLLGGRDGLSDLRQDVASSLSQPGLGTLRPTLELLLAQIDRHGASLATLEQEVVRRRSILDSFVLALEGAAAAKDKGDVLAAVTGPIRDRVTLLSSALEPQSTQPSSPAGLTGERRIREEVRLARQLQRSILPEMAPDISGLSVSHLYRPSSEVGGDFYDFYALGPDRLLVALGDASGHGLDSSMVSSMAKSALYTHVSARRNLSETMEEMNRLMWDTLGKQRLMTLALLEIDVGQLQLRWVNAGQVFPLLCDATGVRELEAPSYPLGVRRQASFEVHAQALAPGDVLLVLTDGYVEAIGEAGEPFGWKRLRVELEAATSRTRDTQGLMRDLAEALRQHLDDGAPQDDVTLIAIGIEP